MAKFINVTGVDGKGYCVNAEQVAVVCERNGHSVICLSSGKEVETTDDFNRFSFELVNLG